MSKTHYVGDDELGFWVYDTVCYIFTAFLLEAAEEAAGDDVWLKERIDLWAGSMWSDLGLGHLDDFSPSQLALVQELIQKAVARLRTRSEIAAAELNAGKYAFGTRATDPDPIPTEPIARYGMALHDMLAGTLPKSPEGYLWF